LTSRELQKIPRRVDATKTNKPKNPEIRNIIITRKIKVAMDNLE
jgi:hypothetical protein